MNENMQQLSSSEQWIMTLIHPVIPAICIIKYQEIAGSSKNLSVLECDDVTKCRVAVAFSAALCVSFQSIPKLQNTKAVEMNGGQASTDLEINENSEPVNNVVVSGLKPRCAQAAHSRTDVPENSRCYCTWIQIQTPGQFLIWGECEEVLKGGNRGSDELI